ncbi:DNA polymerase III subunit delta [Candidatus Gillettellia adelgis]
MIRIYSNQLAAQLRKGLCKHYLLIGNEPLMLQESQDLIRDAAKQQQFSTYYSISLDIHADWDAIFNICQTINLFTRRQILLLIFPDNGLFSPFENHLTQLSELLHNDILLILRSSYLPKSQEKSVWFKALSCNAVYVSCQSPTPTQLPRWIFARAQLMQLTLEDAANKLLSYCYEGNLLALSQVLEMLSLLYPDGILTVSRINQVVYDASYFTPLHWINAILEGKNDRAWHIFQQLKKRDVEPAILLRTLQRELLVLLTIQRYMVLVPLHTLFDQHKVWKNRQNLITQAIHRLSTDQLRQAVQRLRQSELILKTDHIQLVWLELETLSMLLCTENVSYEFINNE